MLITFQKVQKLCVGVRYAEVRLDVGADAIEQIRVDFYGLLIIAFAYLFFGLSENLFVRVFFFSVDLFSPALFSLAAVSRRARHG